jgi:hypothetical protein
LEAAPTDDVAAWVFGGAAVFAICGCCAVVVWKQLVLRGVKMESCRRGKVYVMAEEPKSSNDDDVGEDRQRHGSLSAPSDAVSNTRSLRGIVPEDDDSGASTEEDRVDEPPVNENEPARREEGPGGAFLPPGPIDDESLSRAEAPAPPPPVLITEEVDKLSAQLEVLRLEHDRASEAAKAATQRAKEAEAAAEAAAKEAPALRVELDQASHMSHTRHVPRVHRRRSCCMRLSLGVAERRDLGVTRHPSIHVIAGA